MSDYEFTDPAWAEAEIRRLTNRLREVGGARSMSELRRYRATILGDMKVDWDDANETSKENLPTDETA